MLSEHVRGAVQACARYVLHGGGLKEAGSSVTTVSGLAVMGGAVEDPGTDPLNRLMLLSPQLTAGPFADAGHRNEPCGEQSRRT